MSRLVLKAIKQFFNKRKELPEEVTSMIMGANFHARSFGDEPRVIIFTNGYSPFVYSHESMINFLGKAFPNLNNELKRRASNLMANEITKYLKGGNFAEHVIPKKRSRKSWINNW